MSRLYELEYWMIQDKNKTVHYFNNQIHCETGPAIEYKSKNKESEYYLFGQKLSKQEFEKQIKLKEFW